MKCTACTKNLESYIDGTLSVSERVQMDEHLKECAACRNNLEALTQLEQFVKAEKQMRTSPFLTQRVMAKLETQKPSIRTQTTAIRRLAYAASIAATIALGILAGNLYQNSSVGGSVADIAYLDDSSLEYINHLTGE